MPFDLAGCWSSLSRFTVHLSEKAPRDVPVADSIQTKKGSPVETFLSETTEVWLPEWSPLRQGTARFRSSGYGRWFCSPPELEGGEH
jgi:hypothetical protein